MGIGVLVDLWCCTSLDNPYTLHLPSPLAVLSSRCYPFREPASFVMRHASYPESHCCCGALKGCQYAGFAGIAGHGLADQQFPISRPHYWQSQGKRRSHSLGSCFFHRTMLCLVCWRRTQVRREMLPFTQEDPNHAERSYFDESVPQDHLHHYMAKPQIPPIPTHSSLHVRRIARPAHAHPK